MTFKTKFIASTIALSLVSSLGLAEAATFKTPKNYQILIVDGQKTSGVLSETTSVDIKAGKHQFVVQFKGLFRKGSDAMLHSATDPLVINLSNISENDEISFTYPKVVTLEQAQKFSDKQQISLTINGKEVPKEKASYFILKSEKGFQLDRDYLADLQALNLLYISQDNNKKIEAKNEKIDKCRESGFIDCPNEVKAPITTTIKSTNTQVAKAEVATTATTSLKSIDPSKVNTQMLEGLKSIYNSADADTKEAFKAWLNNN